MQSSCTFLLGEKETQTTLQTLGAFLPAFEEVCETAAVVTRHETPAASLDKTRERNETKKRETK